jgi:murein DD-endopeptidase MepM/ murein hydrolase activator NlpD
MSAIFSGFFQKALLKIKQAFQTRNIIIVSTHKLEHIPVTGPMQLLMILGACVFLCGFSYLAGSYLTASTALHRREANLAAANGEKERLGAEMDAIRRDLAKMSAGEKDTANYKQLAAQYAAPPAPVSYAALSPASGAPASGTPASGPPISGPQDSAKLLERISFLEGKMQQIRDENDHLISAIRVRTDKKISYFRDIIKMTGLNHQKLEHVASRTLRSHANEPAATDSARSRDAKTPGGQTGGQGGPYIPYTESALNEGNRDLVGEVERMMVLHDIVGKLPLGQPVSGAHMTGQFGRRIDPFNGHWAIHPGVDLAGPSHAKIFSTGQGRVIDAGHKSAYGNAIDIDHGFGVVTRYGHLSRIFVRPGQMVKAGQLIGLQGSTGRSTGQHLHYEVRVNDHPVNPVNFLHAGRYVLEE